MLRFYEDLLAQNKRKIKYVQENLIKPKSLQNNV